MHRFDDPTRQAVWNTLRALNDAWTRGNPDRLTDYFHPCMVAVTATDRHRLDGGPACVAGWKAFAEAATIHHWREIDPVVHVYGDAAVVAYDFDMAFDMQGRTIHMGGRDLFFFVREAGRWWAVADQFSAYP
ncbi:MAG: nuclear transport factor 2 family protein [Chromatiales bacterium]|jgi:hypothetical protein|nr:nuclear transport factor 2 family protein [Chromatiales bacterium]MDX9767871.1 nuclear transport factor 2 family protein [Ectothiorhodospiraceae bacterium]